MRIKNADEMTSLGQEIGAKLRGGEVFELIGDVGAGKTTLVKGIAKGLQIDDDVQSPSFTISRNYAARDGLILNHYDFYRLHDAGIMKMEIAETLSDPKSITIIEWGDSVAKVLPPARAIVTIHYRADDGRDVIISSPYENLAEFSQ